MGDRGRESEVEGAVGGSVVVTEEKKEKEGEEQTLKLTLKKKKSQDKKVNWTQETVDNENMGKVISNILLKKLFSGSQK